VRRISEVERLRGQADKARRLAAGIDDKMSKDALIYYAKECDDHAERLELLEEVIKRKG